MKKVVFLSFLFALFSCSDNKPVKKPEPNQRRIFPAQLPRIVFDAETHDFGRIKSGEILSYSFVFNNQGESDLTIFKAETDCGCLQVKIPELPVKPLGKGTIDVVFNSSGMVGKQLKMIEIQSNDKEPKHLIIFADIENELFEINN